MPQSPAISATEHHGFQVMPPNRNIDRMHRHREGNGELGIALPELWLGVAIESGDGFFKLGFACHDGTYTIDFAVHQLDLQHQIPKPGQSDRRVVKDQDGSNEGASHAICDYLIKSVHQYQEKNHYKFLAVGIAQELVALSPQAPSRIWAKLDIVPITVPCLTRRATPDANKGVDELADSMVRKGLAQVLQRFIYIDAFHTDQYKVLWSCEASTSADLDNQIQLISLAQQQALVSEQTWRTAHYYRESIKQRNIKFSFFSATPQGGGVVLMRHALIRFYKLLGVDTTWWVPSPKPEIFRITKTNHNILQGVAKPEERLQSEQKRLIEDWVQTNAGRFWTSEGGPLAPRSEGGVDVVIVDDPQMPTLIPIVKRLDPDRPVIFRSHIQIRSDLAQDSAAPTAEVWNWLWQSLQQADVFISHPVKAFVPHTVNLNKLAYMPATTDWLDGLNKPLSEFDTAYYLHEFNAEATRWSIAKIAYPKRKYVVQIARLDPSKGIPDVRRARQSSDVTHPTAKATPQLVIAGHYSVDDPDGVKVLEQTLDLLDTKYSDIKDDVIAMRLGPTDQILNTLMSSAHVGLQLSTREGFEIKVSEGLHKGVPMIVSNAGGIPL
ncbi:hypothetical protein LTR78_001188 [Recurvomyces mirabilis]|uniref:Glycosyl transferase family 1 domain-containing protein n=1 Tax=Recurvomyces mirabilis TaxID=574656 RepID=A0AAE1C5G1_9PEZI|nr:hypothetical protein LTR78_001188 [Recurvomyces mirabilis]KAK5161164.1 hypothetical protein LTS14_000960 [Recurvomyces mirabilis]